MYLKMASDISHGLNMQTEGSSKDTTTVTVYGDENENRNDEQRRKDDDDLPRKQGRRKG